MSPTIRSVDGKPLMIGGLVAGADECCCENPPPPGCFCADLCSYDIELVSPAITSVRIPANNCLAVTFPTNTTSVFLDDWMFPETDFGDFVPCTEVPGLVGVIKPVSVFSVARRFPGDLEARTWVYVLLCDPSDPTTEDAIVSIRVNLRMACDPWTQQLYVEVQSWAYVGDDDDESNRSSIVINNYGLYRPPSTCLVPGKRICATHPAPWFRTEFLDTPLDVVVRLDETSLGPYTLGLPGGEERGESPNPFRAMFDSVVENTEFTFRITSRPNCKTPIPCDCSASLAGTRWRFEGQDFDWDTGGESWFGPVKFIWNLSGSSPSISYEFYDPDGPVDGDGNPSRLLLNRRVDVFCDTVDGEPTWVVLLRATGFCYDGGGTFTGQSTDSWLGHLLCYEACEDEWHSAGDPIPSGEPEDVVFDNRETLFTECPPAPPRPTLLITQIATC